MKIISSFRKEGFALETTVWLEDCGKTPEMIATAAGCLRKAGWLVLALRPYNPEGIQFIDRIDWRKVRRTLHINTEDRVMLAQAPEKVLFSNYRAGDVAGRYAETETVASIRCPTGMATAAAFFPLEPGERREIEIRVPLPRQPARRDGGLSGCGWESLLSQTARLALPAEKIQFLYDSAVRTLILLTADEAFPGPYTYRRFWFRDACFMINALLALGLSERAGRLIGGFPARQKRSGYFQSQEGEWDSNGQVLWIADRFQQLTGRSFAAKQAASLLKGAEWIQKKRIAKDPNLRHGGLLPAGFSAEHLGPNDFYYWDDFWGVAGLRAAGRIAARLGMAARRYRYERDALDLEMCIFKSILRPPRQRRRDAIPASPYRRMDAGAVGSLVADYPLQITAAGDSLVMNTAEFLIENCFRSGAFFQDMIHSGINPYLTLAIAQTLLRGGDRRYREMIAAVADLASPTGQWPEAVHPITKGGCMGDGQHGWAAAEWIMIVRNLLIREERERIVIGSGIFPEWLREPGKIHFGPTLTPAGRISITLTPAGEDLHVDIETDAKDPLLPLEIAVPGYLRKRIGNVRGSHIVTKG